jgi:hypothetical protein
MITRWGQRGSSLCAYERRRSPRSRPPSHVGDFHVSLSRTPHLRLSFSLCTELRPRACGGPEAGSCAVEAGPDSGPVAARPGFRRVEAGPGSRRVETRHGPRVGPAEARSGRGKANSCARTGWTEADRGAATQLCQSGRCRTQSCLRRHQATGQRGHRQSRAEAQHVGVPASEFKPQPKVTPSKPPPPPTSVGSVQPSKLNPTGSPEVQKGINNYKRPGT